MDYFPSVDRPPRTVRRARFEDALDRVVLLEDDLDKLDGALEDIHATLRWLLRTVIGLLVTVVASVVVLLIR